MYIVQVDERVAVLRELRDQERDLMAAKATVRGKTKYVGQILNP